MGSAIGTTLRIVGVLALGAVLVGAAAVASILRRGISAREEPTTLETAVARSLRHLAVPRRGRDARNPVVRTTVALDRARAHFADHCASCHGNDGRGQVTLGQKLYPKAPDMWLPETQSLSDGELFYIIENGVRLTGMPAWGAPGPEDDAETWELVHFIRHLPRITPREIAEMESMNPMSRQDWEDEEAMRKFVAGESDIPTPKAGKHDH